MRREGTDENNVSTTDVLCDYCHREWSDDLPMVEGHRGACICGQCLAVAYAALVLQRDGTPSPDFTCTMCREAGPDRAALDRTDEQGWTSPVQDAAICRRCTKQAAGVLHKDPDIEWSKPEA